MARRSYRQHCGLAVALDVVGQRWALLIVRDLAPGPRRFSDLFAGLPGISTDMLTERLRELETAGAVEKVELRSPVPATVYQLTGRGRELAAISAELARWGSSLLPPVDASNLRRNPRWALQSFATRYQGGLPDGAVHLLVDEEELALTLRGASASLHYGPPGGAVAARLRCTADEFFAIRTGRADLGLAASETCSWEGDADWLVELLGHMTELLDEHAAPSRLGARSHQPPRRR